MKVPFPIRLGLASAVLVGSLALVACEDSKTTTAPGVVASVRFNAPDNARSGQSFTVDVSAVNVGINGLHNGHVDVTLPSPLLVNSVDASPGTQATFSNASGATVSWTLNTLDSNSSSTVHINVTGMLPAGSPTPMSLTLRASLTADGVAPGDAVATATVMLNP